MLRKQDPDTEIYLTVFYDNYCNLFLRPFEKVDVKPIKLDGKLSFFFWVFKMEKYIYIYIYIKENGRLNMKGLFIFLFK